MLYFEAESYSLTNNKAKYSAQSHKLVWYHKNVQMYDRLFFTSNATNHTNNILWVRNCLCLFWYWECCKLGWFSALNREYRSWLSQLKIFDATNCQQFCFYPFVTRGETICLNFLSPKYFRQCYYIKLFLMYGIKV